MIPASTFDFLKKLAKNNNKEWFDTNRAIYEKARQAHIEFVQQLITNIAKTDAAVNHLVAKDCLFRINRDVRFSKNKSPYKTNFGAYLSPGGKKSFTAGYYLHIQPGESFMAGGVWQPPAPQLQAIRQEIDYNLKEFQKIISTKNFKKHFGALSNDDKLIAVPKGYDKSNPAIDLLKHKSHIVLQHFSDEEILSKNFLKISTQSCKEMLPLIAFLRRACD
jgi:uncharacterized protein (TIGR02453 family)